MISVQERVRQVQRQSWRVARSSDSRYPGSTFEQELKSYGVDGALCVLASGPFANLSEGFHHAVDLIEHEKAAAWLEKRKMNPCAARALFRQGLVQRLGLLVMREWSQLIIERFRDAVTNRPTSSETPGSAQIRGWTSPRRLLRHECARRLNGVGQLCFVQHRGIGLCISTAPRGPRK